MVTRVCVLPCYISIYLFHLLVTMPVPLLSSPTMLYICLTLSLLNLLFHTTLFSYSPTFLIFSLLFSCVHFSNTFTKNLFIFLQVSKFHPFLCLPPEYILVRCYPVSALTSCTFIGSAIFWLSFLCLYLHPIHKYSLQTSSLF